jgi:hypothetical protein
VVARETTRKQINPTRACEALGEEAPAGFCKSWLGASLASD